MRKRSESSGVASAPGDGRARRRKRDRDPAQDPPDPDDDEGGRDTDLPPDDVAYGTRSDFKCDYCRAPIDIDKGTWFILPCIHLFCARCFAIEVLSKRGYKAYHTCPVEGHDDHDVHSYVFWTSYVDITSVTTRSGVTDTEVRKVEREELEKPDAEKDHYRHYSQQSQDVKDKNMSISIAFPDDKEKATRVMSTLLPLQQGVMLGEDQMDKLLHVAVKAHVPIMSHDIVEQRQKETVQYPTPEVLNRESLDNEDFLTRFMHALTFGQFREDSRKDTARHRNK